MKILDAVEAVTAFEEAFRS